MIKIVRPQCPNPTALATNYKHPENKAALSAASFDKCIYCESKISHTYYGDIEHLKPKAKYRNLEFVWENLGYVCARCNGIKDDKYDEANPFLNPYDEDPEEHLIALGAIITYKSSSPRGKSTIDENEGVHLNRPQLVERRYEKLKLIEKIIDLSEKVDADTKSHTIEELKNEAEVDKEYSLTIKHLLKARGVV